MPSDNDYDVDDYLSDDDGPIDYGTRPKKKRQPQAGTSSGGRPGLIVAVAVIMLVIGLVPVFLMSSAPSSSNASVAPVAQSAQSSGPSGVSGPGNSIPPGIRVISGAAISPDGNQLAVAVFNKSGTGVIYDHMQSFALSSASLTGADVGPVQAALFSPDNKLLATMPSPDGPDTVNLWDAASGQFRVALNGSLLAFCANCGGAATVDRDGKVYVWDTAMLEQTGSFDSGMSGILSIAYSPDGRYVAVTGTASGALQIALFDTGAENALWKTYAVDGAAPSEIPMAFDPTNAYLAAGAGDTIMLVALSDGSIQTWANDNGLIHALDFSPDGTRLAVGGGDLNTGEAGVVHVWDVAAQKLRGTLTGHAGNVVSVIYSPDGQDIFTAGRDPSGQDSTIRVWSAVAMTLQISIPLGL